jgi:hypothetical protein
LSHFFSLPFESRNPIRLKGAGRGIYRLGDTPLGSNASSVTARSTSILPLGRLPVRWLHSLLQLLRLLLVFLLQLLRLLLVLLLYLLLLRVIRLLFIQVQVLLVLLLLEFVSLLLLLRNLLFLLLLVLLVQLRLARIWSALC